MDQEKTPTLFLGGIGKLMSLISGMANDNGKKPIFDTGNFALKILVIVFIAAFGFFIGATRDWMTVTKEGAVSSERIQRIESNLASHVILSEQEKTEFVRKDVLTPEIADIRRRLDRIEMLLIERRREER